MTKRRPYIRRLIATYLRYQRKLHRLQHGHSRYRKKDLLIRRLQALHDKLERFRQAGRIAVASSAISAGMVIGLPTIANAQFELKSDNVLQTIHIEADAKPTFVDWDGDGDDDLFVGGKTTTALDSTSNQILYFENIDGRLRAGSSPFPEDLLLSGLSDTARLSPAFIDLDSDGDLDAFAGLSNGTMRYYRNDDGNMTWVTGMDNPFDGIQIGSSNDASPAFADIDGDGDMDAVIGRNDGNISYYTNDNGAFTEVTGTDNPFAAVTATGYAAPALVDFDDDGDIDLFVGNKYGEVLYFENQEGVFAAIEASSNPFGAYSLVEYTAPAFSDVDGDGDIDAFIGLEFGNILYLRNDDGVFSEIPRNTIGLQDNGEVLSYGFVDIDQDGDQDVFSGDFYGTLSHFTNDGGIFSPAASNPLDTSVFMADYNAAPAFADIDGDGDMDAFIGTYQQGIQYFANDAGVFTPLSGSDNPFDGVDPGENENLAFVDWDNDGDLDAFIGNKIGELKYYENNDGAFSEAAASDPFANISFEVAGQPNAPIEPAVIDLDGDGDMDIIVGTITGEIRAFSNDGSASVTELTGTDNPFAGMDFGRASTPSAADIDGDGDIDIIVSNAAGLTFHLDNIGGTTSTFLASKNLETRVFPNPTSNFLQIEAPWLKGKGEITISDLAGQQIQTRVMTNAIMQMDLSQLPVGIYVLEVMAPEGHAVTKIRKE